MGVRIVDNERIDRLTVDPDVSIEMTDTAIGLVPIGYTQSAILFLPCLLLLSFTRSPEGSGLKIR
jgi:hypothetical protein